jgi:putative tricarboxylic transport membrane protein
VRQSLTMSQGDPTILFDRPLTAALLALAAATLVFPLLGGFRRWRAAATGAEDDK